MRKFFEVIETQTVEYRWYVEVGTEEEAEASALDGVPENSFSKLRGSACQVSEVDAEHVPGGGLVKLPAWNVSFEIRSATHSPSRPVAEGTRTVYALHEDAAKDLAEAWLTENDPRYDERINPRVVITGCEQNEPDQPDQPSADVPDPTAGNRFRIGDRVIINRPTVNGLPHPWHGRHGRIVRVPGDVDVVAGSWVTHSPNYAVMMDNDMYPCAPHFEDGLLPERTREAGVPDTRVILSVGDPGKWQAQYYDPRMNLWFDIGDAQADKADADRREDDYRAEHRVTVVDYDISGDLMNDGDGNV